MQVNQWPVTALHSTIWLMGESKMSVITLPKCHFISLSSPNTEQKHPKKQVRMEMKKLPVNYIDPQDCMQQNKMLDVTTCTEENESENICRFYVFIIRLVHSVGAQCFSLITIQDCCAVCEIHSFIFTLGFYPTHLSLLPL